jgi:hypothetical protein
MMDAVCVACHRCEPQNTQKVAGCVVFSAARKVEFMGFGL